MNKSLYIVLLLMICIIPAQVKAQASGESKDAPRLIGKRYTIPVFYRGPQYLVSDTEWITGTIYLANGDTVNNLFLKYNRHQDELIYYNQKNALTVVLDKKQVAGFVLTTGSHSSLFRKITFSRISNKSSYCEVLYDGTTDVLAQRRSELKICPSYTTHSGIKKDRQFVSADRYLIAGKENQLLPLRLKKKSLLLKFGESKKKEISRTIRRNRLSVKDEYRMVQAWQTLEKEGYTPAF